MTPPRPTDFIEPIDHAIGTPIKFSFTPAGNPSIAPAALNSQLALGMLLGAASSVLVAAAFWYLYLNPAKSTSGNPVPVLIPQVATGAAVFVALTIAFGLCLSTLKARRSPPHISIEDDAILVHYLGDLRINRTSIGPKCLIVRGKATERGRQRETYRLTQLNLQIVNDDGSSMIANLVSAPNDGGVIDRFADELSRHFSIELHSVKSTTVADSGGVGWWSGRLLGRKSPIPKCIAELRSINAL